MSSEPKAEVVKIQRAPVQMNENGIVLTSMDDLQRWATTVYHSAMCPPWAKQAVLKAPRKDDGKEDESAGIASIAVAVQTGMEAGLSPSASLRAMIVLPNSTQAMWYGQAALGLIRSSRVCEFFTINDATGDGDARHVTIRCKRFDMPAPVEVSFSMAEARRAGLLGKDNWKNYPDDLLVWRDVSRTAKRYFSDVLMGLEIAEVGQDFTPVDPRPTEAPKEPDPLLIEAQPPAEPPAQSSGEAAPIAERASTATEPVASLPLDEQLLASLVDKLEGKIISAESFEDLDAAWKINAQILDQVSDKERARLTKLYKQNLKNFER